MEGTHRPNPRGPLTKDDTLPSFHSNTAWVRLYRSVIEKGWLTNHKLWTFWSYCLLKASHKETVVLVGSQQVPLRPGEFIFGRKRAATDLNMTDL